MNDYITGGHDAVAIGQQTAVRGTNQSGMRAHNERLILSLVRRNGSMAQRDIAKSTGLSAQTISVIIRQLERDGLLLRGVPTRGRVGQPSVPMSLSPKGAYSIGLKVGRRAADIILIDFLGNIMLHLHRAFDFALPGGVIDFMKEGASQIEAFLSEDEFSRIAGIVIATPFEMWNWAEEIGAPPEKMELWRDFDLTAAVGALVPYPVFLQNDATSACGAELVFGVGPRYSDFIYFYIGSFAGGGVVINSSLFTGKSGNAGAVGSMLVPAPDGKSQQLISSASIIVLERMLHEAGLDPRPLWHHLLEWTDFGAPLQNWVKQSAKSLAHAIVSSASVIDFQAAIIDGNFPAWVRKMLADETRLAIKELDTAGIQVPEIIEGEVGSQARAIGGASLPLFSRYLLDLNALFREPV